MMATATLDIGGGAGCLMRRTRYPSFPRCLLAALAAWALLAPGTSAALDPQKSISQYVHDAWQTADGLPQATVHALLQSSDGYLWFGTQEGLVRFDGVQFEIIDRHTAPEMPNHHVLALLQDAEGAIWMGTSGGGLVRYHEGEITSFSTDEGLASNVVSSLLQTASGDLWVGTDAGLSLYRDGGFTTFGAEQGLPHLVINALLEDGRGRIWVGTQGGGVAILDKERLEVLDGIEDIGASAVRALYRAHDGTIWIGADNAGAATYVDGRLRSWSAGTDLDGETVLAFAEDPDGNLWMGTATRGVVRVHGESMEPYRSADGLTHDRVLSLLVDREGSLWIGTFGGGLNRLRDAPFTTYGIREGLSADHVWSVFEDSRSCLWVGTNSGLDMMLDGQVAPFDGQTDIANHPALALFEDRGGDLWVGTYGDGLWRLSGGRWTTWTDRDGLGDNQVFAVAQDADGVIWAGTQLGLSRIDEEGVTTLTTADGLPHDHVRALVPDGAGALWIGTRGGGLARLVAGRVEAVDMGGDLTPSQHMVMDIYRGRDGTLWLATPEGLVVRRGHRAVAITAGQGLINENLHTILEDDAGNLWISTNHGIMRVPIEELLDVFAGRADRIRPTVFGHEDGMRSEECNGGFQTAGWRTADGHLWFPTIAGVVSFDPSSVGTVGHPPPVVIEHAVVDGQPLDLHHSAVLDPGARRFEFHYTAPTFIGPDNVRFRVRLDGLDDDWVDAGTRRTAYFTNLRPGTYTFHVSASHRDGGWSDEKASYRFSIRPHLYQRPAFFVLCGLLLFTAAAGVHGMRVRRLRIRERALVAAVEERTAELRQMAHELKELSLRDPLTGLRNRRFLFETVTPVMEDLVRRQRHRESGDRERRTVLAHEVMGVFMIDIDHFKRVNDTMGHDAGDQVLKQFAQVLAGCARTNDVVARWGGEEFLLVLPHTSAAHLGAFAERIRQSVEARGFVLLNGAEIQLTCSVGCAAYPFFGVTEHELNLDQVIGMADLGLLQAKQNGRNRVVHVFAGEHLPEDEEELTRALSSLEWGVERGIVATDP